MTHQSDTLPEEAVTPIGDALMRRYVAQHGHRPGEITEDDIRAQPRTARPRRRNRSARVAR